MENQHINQVTEEIKKTQTITGSVTQLPKQEEPVAVKEIATVSGSTVMKGAVLLLIFVLLIGAMVATVLFVPRGINSLASISLSSIFKAKDKVVVSANKSTINSGDQVVFTWNGNIRDDGSYTISYPCKENISVSFHSGELITCDVPFYFSSPDNTAAVNVFAKGDSTTDVPFYLNFKDNDGKTTVVGDTLITVTGSDAVMFPSNPIATTTPAVSTSTVVVTPAPTPKPVITPKPTPKPTPAPATPTGVDLVINVIALGSIDNNNAFTPGTNVPAGSRPAVRFEVVNNGGRTSGAWTFKASTPSQTTPVYRSAYQPSLASGDKVEYTFGFDNTTSGGTVVISVNEDRIVTETNYSNNVLTYNVAGSAGATAPAGTTGKDMTIRFTSSGYIDTTGNYVAANSIPSNFKAAVKFVVVNNGTEATGAYIWRATLPSTTDTTYTSSSQSSIDAGRSVEYTVTFDKIKTGTNSFSVSVDPDNSISENNESNNTITGSLTAY